MADNTNKNDLYIYRLTFGDNITNTDSSKKLENLLIEQGVRKEFTKDDKTYYVTFRGIKINRKIYQPTQIEVELDFMQATTGTDSKESTTAPGFEDVSALLLQRQVKLDILQVERIIDTTRTLNYKGQWEVARNCYVYELNPQIKRDTNGGTKMYVKLNIFSMDKLMTLNKYSKAYVARKLGEEILKPESLNFGTLSANVPLVNTDVTNIHHLTYKDSEGSHEFIQPYLVQYNEPFYDFLVRTANRCGEFLYFEDGKLTLGLEKSSTIEQIKDYESVTAQNISADLITVSDYSHDSIKSSATDDKDNNDRKTIIGELNQSVIDRQATHYPQDAFPSNISSNSEIASDDYFFPLFKDKFTNLKREMYYDGSASDIAMSHAIPFFKTILANETAGGAGAGGSVAKALIVGEGITTGLALKQVLNVNPEKWDTYGKPWKDKKEQFNSDEVVEFASLSEKGWTTLRYYKEVLQYEVSQERKIVCINMGTTFKPVKLGQQITIEGLSDTYVIIQIQQISEVAWNTTYDKYNTDSTDMYGGKRSLKIYAIPQCKDKGHDLDAFYPPVQPVPVIRKAGPQTAYVTANVDPKFQGRVRIAFPWQSLGGTEKAELAEAEQKLIAVKENKEELEKEIHNLEACKVKAFKLLEELKAYVNATPEERIAMMAEMTAEGKDYPSDYLSQMQAAAQEHDQKKGTPDYKDVEKDNKVIRAYKQAYDNQNQKLQEANANLERVKASEKETTEKRDQIAAVIEAKVEDMASPWVRVASPFATPGGGTFFRPCIGDEVLVNFENDNVERPYVVGSLYSKNNVTPDEGLYRKAAPEMQWKDISMSIMSPNGHHLTFTDPPGGGNFFGNLLSPGIGYYGSIFGAGALVPSAKDLAGGIHIGDRYGIYEIEMKSHKRAIDIKSPFGTVSINAFSGITISAPNGDVTIKGKNINIEAGNKITMLSGKNIKDETPSTKTSKVIGTVGIVVAGLTDKFVSTIVDLSLIRHVVEVFLRPVDGTMLIKSKRYLRLEAGHGQTTVARTRYNPILLNDEEIGQQFFQAMITCVNFLTRQMAQLTETWERLWTDVTEKRLIYQAKSILVLKNKLEPDIPHMVYKYSEWKEDDFTFDKFKQYLAKDPEPLIEADDEQERENALKKKYDKIKDAAIEYGESLYKLVEYDKKEEDWFMKGVDDLELGHYDWLKECIKKSNTSFKELTTTADFLYDWNFRESNSLDLAGVKATSRFKDGLLLIYKRTIILLFLSEVNKHASNKKNQFIDIAFDAAKETTVNNRENLTQSYYWYNLIMKMDRRGLRGWLQNDFLRTLWDNSVARVWNTMKSAKPAADNEMWEHTPDGQILFSDQDDATLNFQGEGLHKEVSANQGTIEYLKRTLLSI